MTTSRLPWRLPLGCVLLVLAAGAACAWLTERWAAAQQAEQGDRHLVLAARLLSRALEQWTPPARHPELPAEVSRLVEGTGFRLAVIDSHGQLLAAEPVQTRAGDWNARPEVAAALSGTPGWATANSTTEGRAIRYVAMALQPGTGQADGTPLIIRVGQELPATGLASPSPPYSAALTTIGLAGLGGLAAFGLGQRQRRQLDRLTQQIEDMAADALDNPLAPQPVADAWPPAVTCERTRFALAHRMAQLRANGDRLAAVLGSMVEGVLAVDDKQGVLLVNQAARTLLDIVGPSPTGRILWEIVRNRTVQEAVSAALAENSPHTAEFEMQGKSRRLVVLRATPLPGEPSGGAVLVLHDVTELRRLENMRQEFVTNVSHELKTPLTAIKAYAETLLAGAIHDPEHNVQFVRCIEEQGKRLHELILDLLSLARIESGEAGLEIGQVCVSRLIDLCLSQHRAAASAKRIVIETPHPIDVNLFVLADEEGVRQIFDNLIDNAVKYTADGGQITLAVESHHDRIGITVTDTGIGISPADQGRVFERFYRADKARSREVGGTGLGLAIVKHLVQAFGGSVALTSEPGRGSTFTVWLPRS